MDEELDPGREEAIAAFKETLNDFKRPIIETITIATENMQNTNVLDKDVRMRIDELYACIRRILLRGDGIQGGGAVPSEVEEKLEAVLNARGGLQYLRAHPEARDEFLFVLRQYLKVYPFTLKTTLINSHIKKHTLPPGDIIPNEEEGEGENE